MAVRLGLYPNGIGLLLAFAGMLLACDEQKPAPLQDPSSNDGGGASDAAASSRDGGSAVCGAAPCGEGLSCCLSSDGALSCLRSCGADVVATCTDGATCGEGRVCCFRRSLTASQALPTSLACEPRDACTGQGGPTCTGTCADGYRCTAFGSVRACVP